MNAATIRDFYALLRTEKFIDSLRKVQIFSTLYAGYGYWQAEIDECDRKKIAFTCHHGLYQRL